MKRLIYTSDLADEQIKELRLLLRRNGVDYYETDSSFLDIGALWIKNADFAKAREIVIAETAAFARRARAEWERDWKSKFNQSYVNWLRYQVARRPVEFCVVLAALTMMLVSFAVFPALVGLRLGGFF